jgi:hypothetical protein
MKGKATLAMVESITAIIEASMMATVMIVRRAGSGNAVAPVIQCT